MALIIAYTAIMVLTILASGFLLRSANESQTAVGYAKSMRSFWLAEAGIQQALWELNENDCDNCTTCGSNQCLANTIASAGDYDVVINLANKTLVSSGSYPSRSAPNKKVRTVFASLNGSSSVFTHAVFAKGNIAMSNSALIDSYNSTTDINYSNPDVNGNVGTNSTSSGAVSVDAIELSNSSKIRGAVSTGPGGTIDLNNSAEVTVDGVTYKNATEATLNNVSNHSNNRELPSVVVPSELTSLTAQPAINLWGNDPNSPTCYKTIYSGSYKIPSIGLSNSSKITISGDVTLYVTGNTYLSNSSIIEIPSGSSLKIYADGVLGLSNSTSINNASKIPANFLLYSTYTGSGAIQMSNSTNLYGGIYAPDSAITLSNSAQTFGAYVVKSLQLSNSTKIHYDEALGNLGGGSSSSSYSITTWQEL